MTKSPRSKRPKRDAAAGFATATPHSALYVRAEADDNGVIMVGRWFEAADLVSAAQPYNRLKFLPDADVENVVTRLNTGATIATRLAAERRPPRDDRKRKLRPIPRATKALLRMLDLPSDVSPSRAPTGLPSTIATALQPGLSNLQMPISQRLIILAGGVSELVTESVQAKQNETGGDDAKQAASRAATNRVIAQAVLTLLPVALATLREAAERAHVILDAEPKPRMRGSTPEMRALLRALAGPHQLLFDGPLQLRDKVFGRDTPSVGWIKAVIEAAASRLAADPNADASAKALFAKAAKLSLATLSDALQTSLRAGLRANSA